MEGLLHIIIREEDRNASMVVDTVSFETRLASLKFRMHENEDGWAQRVWDCVQVAAWVVNNILNGLPEWPKKLALLALLQLEKRMTLQHIKSRYYWDDEGNPICAQVIVEMMQIV